MPSLFAAGFYSLELAIPFEAIVSRFQDVGFSLIHRETKEIYAYNELGERISVPRQWCAETLAKRENLHFSMWEDTSTDVIISCLQHPTMTEIQLAYGWDSEPNQRKFLYSVIAFFENQLPNKGLLGFLVDSTGRLEEFDWVTFFDRKQEELQKVPEVLFAQHQWVSRESIAEKKTIRDKEGNACCYWVRNHR
jgi:hypothetical protein